jgi:hypothetical protein
MTSDTTYIELLKLAHEQLGSQSDMIAELKKERDEYHAMVVYMGAIMDESEGVAGYHLNGDIAKWDDLFTTSILEDAVSIRDLEQQAKGAIKLTNLAMKKLQSPKCSQSRLEYFKAGVRALAFAIDKEAKELKEQGK